MRLLHVSDWHTDAEGAEQNIRRLGILGGDPEMLLVTGDMLFDHPFRTLAGHVPPDQARWQRARWLEMVEVFRATWPHATILAVPGNHDWCNLNVQHSVRSWDKLQTKTIKVRGLTVTGFRGIPWFRGTWHGELGNETLTRMVATLDRSADIIITHTPPWNVLDDVYGRSIGLPALTSWFVNHPWSKRRLHVFGHVHEQGGQVLERNGTCHSNASCRANWLTLDR